MTTPIFPFVRAALLALACIAVAADGRAADWRWSGVARIVAVSDVHGAYPAMLRTLKSAGIVADDLTWQGGEAHLVVTGDLLDRGPESRAAMDLLMALEPQAEAAGGRVHMLLGNHEMLNLVGDLRYVSAAEYAAFAAEETAADRDRWYAAASARDPALSRAAFDEAAPPGFFAHRRAFAPDGQYGAWLLGKPLLVVIDGTAFVHGGLSPRATEDGLAGINREMRGRLLEYAAGLDTAIAAGLLLPTDAFYEQPERLAALPDDPARPAEVARAVDALTVLHDAEIHYPDSPLWYRGNVACSPLIENGRLARSLRAIEAERLVIGHTPTPGREVLERLDGRIVEIDTGMLADYYGGSGHALVIEGDRLSVIGEAGDEAAPAAHPRRVDLLAEEVPSNELEAFLADAEIVATEASNGRTLLTLRQGDVRVTAAFLPNPRTRGLVPELAAYRLDRLLGLGMVPATVRRTVAGENGVLQFVPDNAIDEAQRAARGEGSGAWCPLQEQWLAMYGFDALAYNPGRLPDTMLYGRRDWQLMLVGHGNAFAPRKERPPYLRETELGLDGAWIERLAALDNDRLKAELGDVLDRRRLLALYQRRDLLLKEARAAR